MSTTNDNLILKCLSGAPVLFKDICAIYPATLREIAEVGYDNFMFYLNLILVNKPTDASEEVQELINSLSNFEYLLLMAGTDVGMNSKIKEAFHFFIHDNVNFSFNPPAIIVGNAENKYIINEIDYNDFKKIIRTMYFLDSDGEQEIVISEKDNPMVAAMKRKMLQNREKVHKANAKKKEDGEAMSFSDLIASVAIGQCGLNIGNIWDITYYAFHDQLKRLGWRDRFNINQRAALAGAKIDKKDLQHWIRPINSKDKK